MTKKLFLNLTISLVAVFALANCASVPMASNESDVAAKKFEVPANKSRIYVYRNEALGSALKFTLAMDGKVAGQTAADVYYFWDVEPGKHEVACLGDSNANISVNTKAGTSTFVWQEVKMGFWVGQCALHEVNPEEGKAAVRSCKLGFQN